MRNYIKLVENLNEEYPKIVSADWIVNYVAEMNDRDDPYEGEVPEHILTFKKFELKTIKLKDTDFSEYNFDKSLASEYASMPSNTMPPIVYDPIHQSIIDGFHRANAAAMRGDIEILAYSGIR